VGTRELVTIAVMHVVTTLLANHVGRWQCVGPKQPYLLLQPLNPGPVSAAPGAASGPMTSQLLQGLLPHLFQLLYWARYLTEKQPPYSDGKTDGVNYRDSNLLNKFHILYYFYGLFL
jgi:hypothetical protein